MRTSFSDDAIVLRVYDVGETDRFCILLTRKHGRIAARAKGVRKLNSRKGGSLLPLHVARVDIDGKDGHYTVTGASSMESNTQSWHDLAAFSSAERAIELVLKLIEEGEPVEDAYLLTGEFLRACGERPHDLFAVFTLKLLFILGAMPSLSHSSVSHRAFRAGEELTLDPVTGAIGALAEQPRGRKISPQLLSFLQSLPSLPLSSLPPLAPGVGRELHLFAHCLLGNQLGSELKTLSLPGV